MVTLVFVKHMKAGSWILQPAELTEQPRYLIPHVLYVCPISCTQENSIVESKRPPTGHIYLIIYISIYVDTIRRIKIQVEHVRLADGIHVPNSCDNIRIDQRILGDSHKRNLSQVPNWDEHRRDLIAVSVSTCDRKALTIDSTHYSGTGSG